MDICKQESFTIKPLEMMDCVDLQDIHAGAFPQPWSMDDFRLLLLQDTVFGFIARQKQEPCKTVGFVLVQLVVDEADILTIVVAPTVQRKGLGYTLMNTVLCHLHDDQAKKLFLEVDHINCAAQALYRRLGFLKIGERPAYYKTVEGRSTALILQRDLVQTQ